MARLLYTLLVLLLVPRAILHLLARARRQPEYLRHWSERFGFFDSFAAGPLIWIHAVSVGETRAAQPLVAALRESYPDHRILITHMTPTGRATSEQIFGDSVLRAYLPYDTPWAVRRFLNRVRPRVGVVMETELWPNLVAACRARGIPLLLVNGRMSEKSARVYARFGALTRRMLADLYAVAAQAEGDAARLRTLGAPEVAVLGNLKFDIAAPDAQLALGAEFRRRIEAAGPRRVLIAASTREGEEVLLLDALREISVAGLLLLLVPRHPQRFGEIGNLLAARGLAWQRRSDERPVDAATQVWLGDSMGELFAYYAAADVAIVGGSLLDFGSQNLIEPCAVGTPALLGPSTFNFAQAAHDAVAAGAALQLNDAPSLVREAATLLVDEPRRAAMAAAGRAFVARHRGATARTTELIGRAMSAAAIGKRSQG
jgi:3-deoxy-D-manno-octulosonic-acid transferase